MKNGNWMWVPLSLLLVAILVTRAVRAGDQEQKIKELKDKAAAMQKEAAALLEKGKAEAAKRAKLEAAELQKVAAAIAKRLKSESANAQRDKEQVTKAKMAQLQEMIAILEQKIVEVREKGQDRVVARLEQELSKRVAELEELRGETAERHDAEELAVKAQERQVLPRKQVLQQREEMLRNYERAVREKRQRDLERSERAHAERMRAEEREREQAERMRAEEREREQAERMRAEEREREHAERMRAEEREREHAERMRAEEREGGERGELERRMHHLRAAAENLAAIEMHDLAERLMKEADEIDRDLHDHPHGEPGRELPPDFVEKVHNGFMELHRQVEEMNNRLGEIERTIERLHRGR
jgi:hypothetical protein